MARNSNQPGDPHVLLRQYLDSLRGEFELGISQARAYYAIEGIHDLRVATKKMRAFFRLISALQPEFDPRAAARSLKPLYGVAGQLRDIDIQQEIVLNGLGRFQVSEFANELKQMEFALRPALLSSIRELRASALTEAGKNVERALKSIPPEEIGIRLDARMQQMFARLHTMLGSHAPTVLELHDVRKAAKACKYTLDVWALIHKPSNQVAQTSGSLKEVYTHLGTWHDTRVTQDAIQTFLKRETPRNLFDQSAYTALLVHLEKVEQGHLKAFRGSSARLRSTLSGWLRDEIDKPRGRTSPARKPAGKTTLTGL